MLTLASSCQHLSVSVTPARAISCLWRGYLDFTKKPDGFEAPHCHLSQPSMSDVRRAALTNSGDQAEARKYAAVYAELRGLAAEFVQVASLDYLYESSLELANAEADGVLENFMNRFVIRAAVRSSSRNEEDRNVCSQTDPVQF